MYITVPLKDICMILLLAALVVMVIYLIVLFRNLNKTVKKSNEVLEDVKTITEIAEKRSVELDDTIGNVSETINTVSKAIRGQETVFKQLSNIASAVMSIVGIVTGRGKKDEPVEAEEPTGTEENADSKE